MSAVYALYASPEAAQRAVDGLRAAGIADGRITILSLKKLRTITGCVIASCGVVIGMWLERFLIVVPSLGHKYLPYSWGTYRPRPVEIMITISTFAAMTLLYTLFSKFVPIISIWELKVGEHPTHVTAAEIAEEVLGEGRP